MITVVHVMPSTYLHFYMTKSSENFYLNLVNDLW